MSEGLKVIIITFVCIAVVTAVVLPLVASQNPDGLEWSILRLTGGTELEASGGFLASLQERLSFMPGYDFDSGGGRGAPLAGVIGAVFVVGIALATGLIITAARKRRQQ